MSSLRKLLLFLCLVAASIAVQAQRLVSGPMIGHTEFRTAVIWFQLSGNFPVSDIRVRITPEPGAIPVITKENNPYYHIYKIQFVNLQPGTKYEYDFHALPIMRPLAEGSFTTQQLWQWRKLSPDFSFITGSCAFTNHPAYDRLYYDVPRFTKTSKPYGQDSAIFLTMAKEKADFMLWLGDNWYTREVDYYSPWGLHNRAATDRGSAIIQPLLKAMPQYAIWDDHDYGPNDSDKSFHLKKDSRLAFKSFWANPSYGMNEQGIYTRFTWNDVDFFLLDDRWYRSNDEMADSIDGQPNNEKKMFGDLQLEWLKNALLQSKNNPNINFRIIVNGSQVLNPVSPYDCFRKFPVEYNDLIKFVTENKVNGILFLTGDRHHSEIIKIDRAGAYPLYDITSSPLTSGTHKFGSAEKENAYRVLGIDQKQNYTRVSFNGVGRDRTLTATFLGVQGDQLGEYKITASQLRHDDK